MKYFSVPADYKKETIDEYAKLNETYEDSKVIETYGSISVGKKLMNSRAANQLSAADIVDLHKFIEYSAGKNINFNYTINATHMQNQEFSRERVQEIKNFLRDLWNAGVRSLTVALPSIIEMIQSTKYDFKLKTSTLCQVTNAFKARAYKRKGIDRIVVDESINRKFFTLKRIREAIGDSVEIIVNPICHKNCIYRMFHYNQIAFDSVNVSNKISVDYYEHRCVMQRHENINNFVKLSWVRPEDLKYYTSIGINYFKLQGRQWFAKGADVLRTLKCYFEERYDGNLMDLITLFIQVNSFNVYVDNNELDGFIKPFYEKENFCKNDCENCGYCEGFAKRCIDYKKAGEVIKLSGKFYEEYDQYKNMIESVREKELSFLKNKPDNGDFGF